MVFGSSLDATGPLGNHQILVPKKNPKKLGGYRWIKNQIFTWVFPKIVVPQNGWFIMENPIEIHDLGGPPLFLETPT